MPARDHVDYYYVRWSAYAVIDGERVNIAGFDVTYALDNIPMATIYPTIGREPQSGKEAKAVAAFLQARPYVPVEIYVKGETRQDSPRGRDFPGFPYNQDVLVFTGFYQGIGYRSMRSPAGGQVQLTGNAAGFLSALYGSSARTSKTTVKGPGGFAEVANLKGEVTTPFDLASTVYLGIEGAVTNLWLDFIKPFFQAIVQDPSIWGDSDNISASRALDAMDDEEVFVGNADNNLPLTASGMSPGDLAHFIVTPLAKEIFDSWRNSDMWTVLTGIARLFMFHIVPLINTATCAPVYGPLGGDAYVTIGTNEYDNVSIDASTPALISKYVVYGHLGGMSSPYASVSRRSAVVGIFSADELWVNPLFPARGITVSEPAPSWLLAEVSRGDLTRESIGGDRGGVPDAVNPGAFSRKPEADYQDIYNNYLTTDLGDRYAKARMQGLLLEHRRGTVRGRFRLDVCPGSLVNVQVIEDEWQPRGEPKSVLGTVGAVVSRMQAGGAGSVGHASTTFHLTHLRSAQEHTGYGTFLTSNVHPIFGTRFVGARL